MFNVIYALFFRELKTRFGKNRRLGYIWVVGEPMTQIFVILTVVTLIREQTHMVVPDGISIFMFLASGIIPFFMFRNILTQMMSGIMSNLGLFAYKPVKPIHVFIARTLVESCVYFFIFVILMLLVGWFSPINVLPYHFLEVYLCFLFLVFSGFCLGLCMSILNHLVDVLKSILPYVGIVIYITSAVIYPSWIVPDALFEILLYNPYLHIMETLRMNYFENYPVRDGITLLYPLTVNVVLLLVGLWFYYHKRQELSASRV
ncbi:capsule polysaccharide transporter KpsM [Campylobacter sp. MIT 97-5078]|uniref:capsule polysaccharide transporter KpsM n=1 Tax=Campylobacter sp. MIT 97-5078 TaxID=1548153 RepID=UPI000512C10D|nr:ABC transporter permease [Campylobacter sp. MIT 97-5078]KGI55715.1 capsule biosynthesis protein [Campylobacter sp. MIT 97-5078]TQR23262.1 capsule biosynthesis protein [Campylobacter sp. MIT 97-5078]